MPTSNITQPLLQENLLPFEGEAFYMPSFFSQKESDSCFNYLQETIPWRQEPIRLFGMEIMQPRLTAWFGEKDYGYSGITMQAKPFPPALLELKQKLDNLAGIRFNSAMLNLYRNGNDSMGWHRDNEKGLGKFPVIGSVSFGAARKFQFRNYKNKSQVITLELNHGSVLFMRGLSQFSWEHRVPKTIKGTGTRINLTFRVVI